MKTTFCANIKDRFKVKVNVKYVSILMLISPLVKHTIHVFLPNYQRLLYNTQLCDYSHIKCFIVVFRHLEIIIRDKLNNLSAHPHSITLIYFLFHQTTFTNRVFNGANAAPCIALSMMGRCY